MSLNSIDIYDFGAWIDLAPEFDWDDLHPAAEPEPEPTAVTAAAPTSDDTADTYTIPAVEGVQYLVDGSPATAGTVTVGDVDATIVITAEALEGYILEGTASWDLVFTASAVGE